MEKRKSHERVKPKGRAKQISKVSRRRIKASSSWLMWEGMKACLHRFILASPAAYTYLINPHEMGLVVTGLIPAVAPVLSRLPTAGSLMTDGGWRSPLHSLTSTQEQSLL